MRGLGRYPPQLTVDTTIFEIWLYSQPITLSEVLSLISVGRPNQFMSKLARSERRARGWHGMGAACLSGDGLSGLGAVAGQPVGACNRPSNGRFWTGVISG